VNLISHLPIRWIRDSTGRAGLIWACPVKYFVEISEANLTGVEISSSDSNATTQPRPLFSILNKSFDRIYRIDWIFSFGRSPDESDQTPSPAAKKNYI
jgi:hypothetical protein